MMRRLLALLCACAAVAGVAAPAASAQVPLNRPQTTPEKLYEDGYDNRRLLGGEWLLKRDRLDVGEERKWERQSSRAGWQPVTVPSVWNAGDESNESMVGGVAYYRKDFRLPRAGGNGIYLVRFESVNYRAKIYLNGRLIGEHTGSYLPFEVPLRDAKAGNNRLVIRVDNVRKEFDFPPSGFNNTGQPVGGWWNYGGINREVYIRRVNRLDFGNVQVRPIPNQPGNGAAGGKVEYRVDVRNYSSDSQSAQVVATFDGRRTALGRVRVGSGATRTVSRTIDVGAVRLWSPADPFLYESRLALRAGNATVGGFTNHVGFRTIALSPDGRMLLNGAPTDFRGVGLHEDVLDKGSAIDNSVRDRYISDVKELGATIIRTHYPLSPYMQELADRNGILVWSEVPVYSVRSRYFQRRDVRQLAYEYLRENIYENQNHPSVVVWSIGNELASKPPPALRGYMRGAATVIRRLDPTRLSGIAIVGYPQAGCSRAYNRVQVIGVNEYFGWYPGPGGQVADRDLLSSYLDSVRACYPNKAIVITEFGAEANRDGPAEEKGTYAFQEDFINFHLEVFATKPWLSGAIYWTSHEFRVRPGWDGGNPKASPPYHQKGVVKFDGTRKPGFADLQRWFSGTQQYGLPAGAR